MDYITQPQGGRELICSEGGEIIIKPNAKITAEPGAIITGWDTAMGVQTVQNACYLRYGGPPVVYPGTTGQGSFEWDTNVYDPAGMHSTSADPEIITIPEDGIYNVSFFALGTLAQGTGFGGCSLVTIGSNTLSLGQDFVYSSPDGDVQNGFNHAMSFYFEQGDTLQLVFDASSMSGNLTIASVAFITVTMIAKIAT